MSLKGKVIKNTAWLLSEKIINIFGLIFITSFVAKYIGPDNFGKLSLATYMFSIIQTVSIWGTDTICTKKISRNYNLGLSLLFHASRFRNLVFLITTSPLIIYLYFNSDATTLYFAIAVAISTLITIQDVYVIINDATYNSKLNVISNVIGLVISLVLRFSIVELNLPIIFICIPIITLNLIPFLIRFYIFRKENILSLISADKITKKFNSFVFYSGLPLVISSISVAIYFNSSRLMLAAVENTKMLGIYSVAITLGSSWSFISYALVTSVTPKLFSSKNLDQAGLISSFVSQVIIIISILYFLFFVLFGKIFIHKLYGIDYIYAYEVCFPIIIATCLSSLGVISSRFIIFNNGYSYLGKKNIFTCIFSIFFSYVMISKYSLIGAAY
ncbi:oligosaccharide flippase family protein, partial [Rosenbergiella nectarea]